MPKVKSRQLDFVIDKLTNSIQNTISGDSFETEVSLLRNEDMKQVIKKNGWNFDWKKELKDNSKEVYKLTIVNNLQVVQGLMSLSRKKDHIFMELLETAPFNLGRNKLYEGVPGNLVAYACRLSFQIGFEGFVSFISKTKLINHYEKSLGAEHFGGHLMVINTEAAQLLVDKYFKTK
jgi:hypothetical protein